MVTWEVAPIVWAQCTWIVLCQDCEAANKSQGCERNVATHPYLVKELFMRFELIYKKKYLFMSHGRARVQVLILVANLSLTIG